MAINPFYLEPHLILDIGNTKIAGTVFVADTIVNQFRIVHQGSWMKALKKWLEENGPFSAVLLGSVAPHLNKRVGAIFQKKQIPFAVLQDLSLDVKILGANDGKVKIGSDRLADTYGALKLHPGNSITVAMGTALVFNVVGKERSFRGGLICPGIAMCARALATQTALLPLVHVAKPSFCCSQTTEENISGGIYYSILGAVEKIVQQLKQECFPREPATVIMTGGVFSNPAAPSALTNAFVQDLKGIVDAFEPNLTVIGMNEIFKRFFLIGSPTY